MKKLILAVLFVLTVSSCQIDRYTYKDVAIRIENETQYTLVFSGVDAEDKAFYPESSFTLQPGEIYWQSRNDIGSYDPICITPTSLTLEWEGGRVTFTEHSPFQKNPCLFDNWFLVHSFQKYGAHTMYWFHIFEDDLEEWSGD